MLVKKYFDGVEITSIEKDRLLDKLNSIAVLIKKNQPEVKNIILYGSFVKNDYTPHSDVDICFILTGTEKPFIERQDDYIGYFQDIPLDVNIVVYTIQEIDKMKNAGNQFIREVLEGIEM